MRKRSEIEKSVDKELIEKGSDVISEFDASASYSVSPRKKSSRLISIRLPMEMIETLRKVATQKGDIGYQRMIKRYVYEGLLRETRLQEKKPFQGEYFIVTYDHPIGSNEPILLEQEADIEVHNGIAYKVEV